MKRETHNSKKKRPNIMVVGDLIVDVHHFTADGGTSTEAAVPLALHQKTEVSWGGAGLVVRNLLTLGIPVSFITLIGNDEYARVAESFEHKLLRKIFFREMRTTVVKERFLINDKKVLRMNRGNSAPPLRRTAAEMLEFVEKHIKAFDLLVVSDYRHGLLSEKMAGRLIRIAKRAGKRILVDSQVVRGESNHHWYKNADIFCLNQKEASRVDTSFNPKILEVSLRNLRTELQADHIIVKLGERGSANLISEKYFETRPPKVDAVDPVGAGDAFLAALASQSALGEESIRFANRWAALATTIRGTKPPTLVMLKRLP